MYIFWIIGKAMEKHNCLNHISQHQNLFSIAISDRHVADLFCNLDTYIYIYIWKRIKNWIRNVSQKLFEKIFAKSMQKKQPMWSRDAILNPFGISVPALARFLRPIFRSYGGGSGWIDFGLPWGTLGLIVLTCWQNLGAILLQMSNIPKWQSQLPKKQRLSQTNTNNQYGQITVYLAGAWGRSKNRRDDQSRGTRKCPRWRCLVFLYIYIFMHTCIYVYIWILYEYICVLYQKNNN